MTAPILADEASFYRAALLGGLIGPAQVIAWADAWIMREERVPDGLIDISLSGGRLNQMADVLGELGPEHLMEGGFRLYAGLLRERWEAGATTPHEIAELLYSLALYHSPPGTEDELKRFSYDFELVKWTDETEGMVEERLWAFLNGWG